MARGQHLKEAGDQRKWEFALAKMKGKSDKDAFIEAAGSEAKEMEAASITRQAARYSKDKLVKKYILELSQKQALENGIRITALAPQAIDFYTNVMNGSEEASSKVKKDVADKILEFNAHLIPKQVEHTHNTEEVNLDELIKGLLDSGAAGSLIKAEAIDVVEGEAVRIADSSGEDSREQDAAIQAPQETETVS